MSEDRAGGREGPDLTHSRPGIMRGGARLAGAMSSKSRIPWRRPGAVFNDSRVDSHYSCCSPQQAQRHAEPAAHAVARSSRRW